MENKKEIKLIDIDKVLEAKNPKLAKRIPRFLVSYLKRILHQREINKILIENKNNFGVDFTKSIIESFDIKTNINGFENIPTNGRYIFVSNHPLGGLESFVLANTITKKIPQIKFLVNDILMFIENLQEIFMPVNKHGGNTKEYLKNIEKTFNSDNQVVIFPAGLVSRRVKGEITDLEWKKSFISMAIKHERDVIPIHVEARSSNFFYNLSNFRKFIGIKANIEMLYLADETIKQKGKTITVTFGKSISYKTFDKSKSRIEWAQYVKNIVYKLPKNINKSY